MPKGKGTREADKTLKQRFKRQATRIATTKSGLSQKEIGRRALAQASRHHARAAIPRDTIGKKATADTRAFAKASGPERVMATPRKTKKAGGRAIRAGRTAANQALQTGQKLPALKAGRKAVKKSVRKGTTSVKQGRMALTQLASMDPTTRREFLNKAAVAASRRTTRLGRSDFRNQQGQGITAGLKHIRAQAKSAGKGRKAKAQTPSKSGRRAL